MLFRVVTLFTFALALIFSSCAPEHSQIVLAEFGNQKIKMGEFEKAYADNAGGYEQAAKDSLSKLKNFLNLYVDFRMKLRDAFVRGFDQDSALQQELKDYKQKVGVTYYLENNIVDPALHQLYDRRKWELRISHIMFRPDSSGDANAEKLANEILDSLKNGASFAEMAKKYSQDKFSAPDGGDLFYITAGELPASFEDACYATEPGHFYPNVVKTRYGFHIIEVTGKRPRVPEIRASHILVSYYDKQGKIDSAAAKAKIDTVLAKLKAGEDFAKLAKEYSDDPGSKDRGGDLGYFQIRQMVKPFAEAAFDLKNIGDITGIVQTRYGYHIIKLTGRKPYPTFEENKEELKKIYKQQRYQEDYDNLVAKLKQKYDFKENTGTLNDIVSACDTLKVGEQNSNLEAISDKTFLTYSGGSLTAGEFIKKMYSYLDFANQKITATLINNAIAKVAGDVLIDQEALNLDNTDPKFAALMENYMDGIYIFKLQEDEVWNKVKIDTTKLYNFYLGNKKNYVWPDRVDFAEIYAKSDSAIKSYYNMLKEGQNFELVAAKFTERPGYKEKGGNWGMQDVSSSQLASTAYKLDKSGDYSEPFTYEGGYSIVKLIKKDPSHEKTFEEAKAEVSGAYQEVESKQLENNYIDSLDKLYHPQIFYNQLEEAFKSSK